MNQGDGKLFIVDPASERKQIQHQTQPRSILEEDVYVDTLTHIVTRDYYPSLPSLRRDNAILEARSRGDIAAAVTVRRKYRKDEEKREREWQENLQEEAEALEGTTTLTHYNANAQKNNIRKRPRPLKHETVTGFHARVTSEDNAEFERNQERERKKLEENLGIVYSASANKDGRLKIETALNKQKSDDAFDEVNSRGSLLSDNLGLASDDYNATPSGVQITKGDGKPNKDSRGISRNGLFFEPRHQNLDEATFNSDKLLMPPPPKRNNLKPTSIVPIQQFKAQPPMHEGSTAPSSSKIECHKLVEYIPKSSEPNINPPATRFPYQNESRLLPKNSNNHNHFEAIRRSNSHMSDTSASESTDLDSSPRSLERERRAYQKAKVRENETFVPMTPLIRPAGNNSRIKAEFSSKEERTRSSELNNASSVGAEDSMQPTFEVVDTSSREKMARKAEKVLMDRSKTYRSGRNKSKRKSASGVPEAKFDPLDRSASLTPAGRALLQASSRRNPSSSSMFKSSSSSRKNSVRANDSFGSALRTAYTPKPNKRGRREDIQRRNSFTPAMMRAALDSTPRINKSEGM